MRHLIFVVVACACLVAGCGEIDMTVDGASAPDAGLPMGDGGPMSMGDTGPTLADSGTAPTDSGADAGTSTGEDASVPAEDAAMPMGDAGSMVAPTCGNAVLDPGEICDPGHLVRDDAGVHAEVSSADRTMCPDCHSIVCPAATGSNQLAGLVAGTGTSADNRCVYVMSPSFPVAPYRRLSWETLAERNAYFAVIRALPTPVHGSIPVYRRAISPATSCPGSGGTGSPLSAGCVAIQPGSMCVASGSVGRCMAWYWTSEAGDALDGMPVSGLPTSSDSTPQAADSYASVSVSATSSSSSQQVADGAPIFVVLDPPPYL